MSTPITLPDLLRVRRESLDRKLKVLEASDLTMWMDSPVTLRKVVELLVEAEEYIRPLENEKIKVIDDTTEIKDGEPDWYVNQNKETV